MANVTDYIVNSYRKLVETDKPADKPKPRGYSARANPKVEKYFATKPRDKAALDMNWNIYSTSEVPFAAITVLSYNVAGEWKIRSEDPKLKEIVEKFCYDTDFNSILIESMRFCLIFGDSFVEKVGNSAGDLVELRVRDPRTFQKEIDPKGDTRGYLQVVTVEAGSEEEIKLKDEEVVHYQLFPKPDSPYGLALIDPSKDTILRKALTDQGIAAAIDRHGYPKYHIVLKTPPGFETELPTPGEIDTIAADFRNINAKNEIVTTELIDIKPLDTKGIENVQDYFNYFQSNLTCGMLVPQEVLGLGSGSTEATARVRRLMFEKMVKGFQNKLARTTELYVFKDLIPPGKKIPRLIFADVVPEDDKILADIINKIMPKGDPYGILTQDEFREKLGYPPREIAKKAHEEVLKSFLGPEFKSKENTQTKNISDLENILSDYEDKVKHSLRNRLN